MKEIKLTKSPTGKTEQILHFFSPQEPKPKLKLVADGKPRMDTRLKSLWEEINSLFISHLFPEGNMIRLIEYKVRSRKGEKQISQICELINVLWLSIKFSLSL